MQISIGYSRHYSIFGCLRILKILNCGYPRASLAENDWISKGRDCTENRVTENWFVFRIKGIEIYFSIFYGEEIWVHLRGSFKQFLKHWIYPILMNILVDVLRGSGKLILNLQDILILWSIGGKRKPLQSTESMLIVWQLFIPFINFFTNNFLF